jgi:hypothetical protein
MNGSGAAIPVFDGAGLRHRQNNARQRAALAVYYRGLIAVEPSQRMAMETFGASAPYFRGMLDLPEVKLRAIAEGWDDTRFAELAAPKTLALPAPTAIADEPPVAPVNCDQRARELRDEKAFLIAEFPQLAALFDAKPVDIVSDLSRLVESAGVDAVLDTLAEIAA